jgi:hypothetical protein
VTFYFLGGEMSAFIPSDATTTDNSATTAHNTAFARSAVGCGYGAASQYGQSAAFAAPDECYYHFDIYRPTVSSTAATGLELVATSTGVFRIRTTNLTLQMQAWISSAWADIGSPVTWDGTSEIQTLDLYIDGNSATGTAKLYLAGTLRETAASVDLSNVTGVTSLRSYGIDTASGHLISQVIVADEPTIGMRLASYYPSGAGATADWTGDYTSVDEVVLSDADFIYSSTNGQVELFTTTGPSLTGYVVRAVGVYARSKKGAAGVANLQLALRISGTNYYSANMAQDVGYSAYGNIWATNPDTVGDWLVSQIAALQPGVRAVT